MTIEEALRSLIEEVEAHFRAIHENWVPATMGHVLEDAKEALLHERA